MTVCCRAVLLDAAGVLVLPDPALITAALAPWGVAAEAEQVSRAHYLAVRRLDRDEEARKRSLAYFACLSAALGVAVTDAADAARALAELEDRRRAARVLWSYPAPGARETVEALTVAGLPVVVVTNSDGHAAENLRDAGICQVGPGLGARVAAVVDSMLVGSAKPDRTIFDVALAVAGVPPSAALHAGDTVHADVVGARRAGIEPVHVDPLRLCRERHRHVRSLRGLRHHLTVASR